MPELFYYPAFWIFVAIVLLTVAVSWHGATTHRLLRQAQQQYGVPINRVWQQQPGPLGFHESGAHQFQTPGPLESYEVPDDEDQPEQVSIPAGPVKVDASKLKPWIKQSEDVVTRLRKLVAYKITLLDKAAKRPRTDPLIYPDQASLFGTLRNAITIHGNLIEYGIYHCLLDFEQFAVWRNQLLEVTTMTSDETDTVQVDLIVFNKVDHVIRAYEIKRGFAHALGSHTERALRKSYLDDEDLRKFAGKNGYAAAGSECHVISWYGHTETGGGDAAILNFSCVDHHFFRNTDTRMAQCVESMTQDYKKQMQNLLVRDGLWSAAAKPAQKFQTPDNVVGFKSGVRPPVLDVSQ